MLQGLAQLWPKPLDQSLQLMGLSRDVGGGKLKTPRTQIKAQGIAFTQSLLREVT